MDARGVGGVGVWALGDDGGGMALNGGDDGLDELLEERIEEMGLFLVLVELGRGGT